MAIINSCPSSHKLPPHLLEKRLNCSHSCWYSAIILNVETFELSKVWLVSSIFAVLPWRLWCRKCKQGSGYASRMDEVAPQTWWVETSAEINVMTHGPQCNAVQKHAVNGQCRLMPCHMAHLLISVVAQCNISHVTQLPNYLCQSGIFSWS